MNRVFMNRAFLIRRLRGPAFLILVGITALLNQCNVIGFWRSWPLYLILAGVFMLAERAAIRSPESVGEQSATAAGNDVSGPRWRP